MFFNFLKIKKNTYQIIFFKLSQSSSFFVRIFWKKISWKAAFLGMILNFPIYGFLIIFRPDIPFLHSQAITFLSIILFITIYTLIWPQKDSTIMPNKYFNDYKLSPIVKYWGISICILTSMLILYFR